MIPGSCCRLAAVGTARAVAWPALHPSTHRDERELQIPCAGMKSWNRLDDGIGTHLRPMESLLDPWPNHT
jgi:hypothetical protein